MAIALNQCPGALNQVDVLFGCIIKRFKDTLHSILSLGLQMLNAALDKV